MRFVAVEWLPCPEREDVVGECRGRGRVELIVNGHVAESVDTQPGDHLLVAEGSLHPMGAPMVARGEGLRSVRADLPPTATGLVRFSEPPSPRLDEVTGLTRGGFGRGEGSVILDLLTPTGAVAARYFLPRGATTWVDDGATVTRGALLATFAFGDRDVAIGGLEALRDFLDSRLRLRASAAVAPHDGIVEAIERTRITLRRGDGRSVHVRRRASSVVTVTAGDAVLAGDALDMGQRSHHKLLRAWGRERLARHMCDELAVETARRGLAIPRVYWALVVRALLAWHRVLRPGDTGLRRHQIVSTAELERARRETLARGGAPATVTPVLRALARVAGAGAGGRGARARG